MTRIFISHSHADEAIAYELVDFLIEALGLNSREILCTSNPDLGLSYSSSSITDQLKGALINSEALIVLITADSLNSAWIPFEAGSFWTTDKPIIPILGPGLTQNDLPGPLKSFLSIAIGVQDVEDKVNSATNQLAAKLNLQQVFTRRRNIKWQGFLKALKAWQSRRPVNPDLQQENEELKIQIQELERSHQTQLEEVQASSQQEKEELVTAFQQEKEELEQSFQAKIQQLEQELAKGRSRRDPLRGAQKEQLEEKIKELEKEQQQNPVQSMTAKSFTEDLDGVKLEMVAIPGGKFIMGSPESEGIDSEKPQHEVTVQPFYIGKYSVTQAQYKKIMGKNPSSFTGEERKPVERVSWNDAVEFCRKISEKTGKEYRLPSEAEWEYACRSVISKDLTVEQWNEKYHQPYYFGESITGEQVNYYETVGRTTIVGKYPPNAFGLYDMHGNVWEWCQDDWHKDYIGAPSEGNAWLSSEGNKKVIRGGSWFDDPYDCRSASRFSFYPEGSSYYYGFRVVCRVPRTAILNLKSNN